MGIFISIGIIVFNFSPIASGEENNDANWWNSFLAWSDNDWFDWGDVFNPLAPLERGKDLYNLIYRKQTRDSTKTAVNDVAKSYGLTTNEARAVLDGSLTPIFNNPKRKGTTLKLEVAEKIAADMQDNFRLLQEIYQIQEEVELATKPSEMFSNGDLSDSGFDLVHDLAMIEKVLFMEQKPVSVGGLLDEALPSPYVPVKPANEYSDYAIGEDAVPPLTFTQEDGEKKAKIPLDDDAEADKKDSEDEETDSDEDREVTAEVLENDICIADNSLAAAIGDMDDAEDESGEDDGAAGDGAAGDGDDQSEDDEDDSGSGSGDGGDNDGAGSPPLAEPIPLDETGKVKPAPADKWGSQWCPGLEDSGSFAGAQAQFPPDMFKGASGSSSKSILSGGAAANYNAEGFAAHVGICFETRFIKETVSSYQPGDSCVACEVEQINKAMEETLSHSLIPNKTTGNLFESGKCKDTGSLVNIQFVLIKNPIPTPVKDDLIFGKNILEEWNKFADNYKPLLLSEIKFDSPDDPELSGDFQTKLQENITLPDITQAEMVDQVRKTQAQATSEAAVKVKNSSIANEASNTTLFFFSILEEIKQMNDLFQSFQDTFKKIDSEALKKLISKPSK